MDIATIGIAASSTPAKAQAEAAPRLQAPDLRISSFDKLASQSLDGVFLSPKMSYDSEIGRTILIFRDSETGAELKRYPAASSEIDSYLKAESTSDISKQDAESREKTSVLSEA